MKLKKLNLAAQIGIAMILGIIVGALLWLTMGSEEANKLATEYIKPFGDIFVNLLKFIVVPLVLFSIMEGVISMKDITKVGKIGWKTVAYFMCTTAFACVIGLVIACLFKGAFPVLELAEGGGYQGSGSASLIDTIKNIFPSNIIAPLSSASMLQIIFISLIFGCGILVAGEKGKPTAEHLKINPYPELKIDTDWEDNFDFVFEITNYDMTPKKKVPAGSPVFDADSDDEKLYNAAVLAGDGAKIEGRRPFPHRNHS